MRNQRLKVSAARRASVLAAAAGGLMLLPQAVRAQDQTITPTATTAAGLNGRYFNTGTSAFNSTTSVDYTGTPVFTRVETLAGTQPQLNLTFNATTGRPDANVGTVAGSNLEKFGAQYLGKINIGSTGGQGFTLASDDGSRLFIDGMLVINDEGGQGATTNITKTINLTAGLHDIRLDYVQGTGGGIVRLSVPTSGALFTTGATNAYTADLDASGTNTTTVASAPFDLRVNDPQNFSSVGLGTLTGAGGATLNVTGFDTGTSTAASLAGKTIRYGTTDLSGLASGNTFTVNSDGNIAVGQVTGGAAGSNLVNAGTGRLVFDNTSAGNTFAGTVEAQGGNIVAIGSNAAGSVNPLGAAGIRLNGGGLVLDSKIGNVTFNNALTVSQSATLEVVPDNVTLTLGGTGNGVSLGSGAVLTVSTDANSQNLNVSGANLNLAGPITGGGGLTKTDDTGFGGNGNKGTLTLSGAGNTYSGPTALSSGTLVISAAQGLGNTSAFTMAAGTTLNLNAANATVATNPAFTVPATSRLIINNATALNTDVTLGRGAAINNGANLELNAAANGTGTISRSAGAGFITIRVTNAAGLTGAQYGPTSIQPGELFQIAVDNISNINQVTPSAIFEIFGGSRTENAGINLNRTSTTSNNDGMLTQEGAAGRTFNSTTGITLGANGGIIASSTGQTLTLAQVNINGGSNTLVFGSSASINGQAKAGTVTFTSTSNAVGITAGAVEIRAGTLSGLSGGQFFNIGGGTGITRVFSGATFSSGTSTLANTTLQVDTGGTARWTATATAPAIGTPKVAGLSGAGNAIIGPATADANSRLLTIGANNVDTEFSGVLSSNITFTNFTGALGSLEKTGTGALTLSGATDTYRGFTTVTSGRLVVNNAHGTTAAPVGSYTIAAAGTLGGTGPINLGAGQSVTVNGTISPGNSPGTLTIAGPVVIGSGGSYLAELDPTGTPTNDVLALTGAGGTLDLSTTTDTLNLVALTPVTSQATYTIATFASATGTFDSVLVNGGASQANDVNAANYAAVDYTDPTNIKVTVNNLAAVPEPASLGLLGLGAFGLLGRRRRRA